VQNRVDRRNLGTVTAQAAFFRIVGAAVGTAALGAVLASRLAYWQVHTVYPGRVADVDPALVRRLAATSPDLHAQVVDAFARSLHTVFLVATPVMAVAFLLTFLLPDTRLRSADAHAGDHQLGGHPGGEAEAPAA
jgi:hypothetical protein